MADRLRQMIADAKIGNYDHPARMHVANLLRSSGRDRWYHDCTTCANRDYINMFLTGSMITVGWAKTSMSDGADIYETRERGARYT